MIAFLTNLKRLLCNLCVGKSLESCAMSSKMKLGQYMERRLFESFKKI